MLYAIVAAAIGGWFSILCLSVFAHRSIAHRAVTLHPVVAHVMRFWLWFSTGTPTRRWVAVHRKHHVFTDGEGDPHSPVLYGLPRVFFGGYWLLSPRGAEARDDRAVRQGLPRTTGSSATSTRSTTTSASSLMLALDIGVFGVVPGLVAYAIQIIWVVVWAAGFINGIGHALGYRNWQTQGHEPQHHADRA